MFYELVTLFWSLEGKMCIREKMKAILIKCSYGWWYLGFPLVKFTWFAFWRSFHRLVLWIKECNVCREYDENAPGCWLIWWFWFYMCCMSPICFCFYLLRDAWYVAKAWDYYLCLSSCVFWMIIGLLVFTGDNLKI